MSAERRMRLTGGIHTFVYYRAMLAQSAVMRLHVVRPSVRLSVCDDQVTCSNRFEFFENNFTAE